MATTNLITQTIRNHYTQENYVEKVKNQGFTFLALHFDIAREQHLLPMCIEKASLLQITFADLQEHNFTPLMIATALGNLKVVVCLLKKAKAEDSLKSVLTAKDTCGWTPLHHAFHSEKIFNAILKETPDVLKKTLLSSKNNLDGTPEVLRYATGQTFRSESAKHVSLQLPDGNKKLISNLKATQLKTGFGLEKWIDDPIRASVGQLWKEIKPSFSLSLTESNLRQFQKNPPHLTIRRNPTLENLGTKSYELVTDVNLPEGTIVCEYSAKEEEGHHARSFEDFFSPEIAEKACYFLEGTTAEKYGNAGRFANHGINCHIVEGVVDGVNRKYLVSLGLKAGQAVECNYGLSSISFMLGRCHVITDPEYVKKIQNGYSKLLVKANENPFDPKHLLSKMIRSRKKNTTLPPFDIKVHNAWIRSGTELTYVADTPAAALHYFFSNILDPKEYKKVLLDDSLVMKGWRLMHGYMAWCMVDMADVMIELENLGKSNLSLIKQVYATLNEILRDHTVMTTIKAMYTITEALSKGEISQGNWSAYRDGLFEVLKTYNRAEDISGPFNVQHVVTSCLRYLREANYSPERIQADMEAQIKQLREEGNDEDWLSMKFVKAILEESKKLG